MRVIYDVSRDQSDLFVARTDLVGGRVLVRVCAGGCLVIAEVFCVACIQIESRNWHAWGPSHYILLRSLFFLRFKNCMQSKRGHIMPTRIDYSLYRQRLDNRL